MAIAAMVILGVLIWLLTSQAPLWESRAALYTYVHDAGGLTTGAPVRLNGIPIGSVSTIELTNLDDPRRYVRIRLEVRTRYLRDIPIDSIAGVAAESVLGSKFISINRGQSPARVKPGAVLPSEPSAELEALMRRGFTLLDSAHAILARLDRIVAMIERGQGNVGKFIVDEELYSRLVSTIAEYQKIATAMTSGQGTIGRLLSDDALYNEARSAVAGVDALIAGLQKGEGTAGQLLKNPALYDEARASVAELRVILQDIRSGKGTAGKLVTDDQLYQRIASVTESLDKLLTAINQGEGTIGQLVVNRALYDNLTGTTDELRALLRDIRANPKKFLRFKVSLF